ncbi:unnamed protein product [Rotaria sp. Silwood1]|nr:unnamed protein product [Rotaria sp. Silwood1]CAF1613894.1 unnamed protein product [Rotaria sp. Silwood1]CAF3691559.1 unnamed protein product [Rotaria sp. Silwood1]CAF3740527.1 unnamed protein product [Rotaria sp. Silwood1]CAF3751812.1 unnamed protein product [Rotaria sp. Silwood1]
MMYLIEQNLRLIEQKQKLKAMFYINYYLRHSSTVLETIPHRHRKDDELIGFSSNLIINSNIKNPFTKEELALLNRGPSYIIPCQLQVSSSSNNKSNNRLASEQFTKLETQIINRIKSSFYDLPQTTALLRKLKVQFGTMFNVFIPTSLRQRSIYEQQLVQAIQESLKKNHFILRRTANHSNQIYLTKQTVFQEKCHEFMIQYKDQFELLYSVTSDNYMDIYLKINDKIVTMNRIIETLFKQKHISKEFYQKLLIHGEDIKLGYMYFLPDISMENDFYLFVKPMFSMAKSLTWNIANFLHRVLQPTLFYLLKSILVSNDCDFFARLNQYYKLEHHHQFSSSTQFVRIKIKNYSTMYSYETIMKQITVVLNKYPCEQISIGTIRQLLDLYFNSNWFFFEKNIFRLVHGMPESLHLSELLMMIASYPWQQTILNDYRLKREFFVRYKDEIFFTWNYTDQELARFLKLIEETHRDVQMDITFGFHIQYLNASIENQSGQLHTRMYDSIDHTSKLNLPYVNAQSIDQSQLYFRSALVRIVSVCSSYEDFVQERIYLEMAYLRLGHSIDLIEFEMKHFYDYFHIHEHRFNMNQTMYEKLRTDLLVFLTSQRASFDPELELESNESVLRLDYFYDYGSNTQFQLKFHELWSHYMKTCSSLSTKKLKIALYGKHVFSLNTLLTKQDSTNQQLKISCSNHE